MTYDQLIARIAQVTHRSDLGPQMANFVQLATEQIEARLTVFLDPPSPTVTNFILETQPALYLYAALVSAYEFINEGDQATYYHTRWLDEVDRYYVTSTSSNDTLVMGGGAQADTPNPLADQNYMPRSGGTFTGPVYGLTPVPNSQDTQYVTTQYVYDALQFKVDASALGNAAYATLTASNVDTTANRVTRVGDFGVGVIGNQPTLANLDVTADIPSGLHRFANGLGTRPPNGTSNALVFIERYSSTIIKQTYTNVIGGSAIPVETWVRTSSAVNTFGPWVSTMQLGYNQKYYNDTAIRALNTTYTNFENHTVAVYLSGTASLACSIVATIGADTVTIGVAAAGQQFVCAPFLVPGLSTYRIAPSAGVITPFTWVTLRI